MGTHSKQLKDTALWKAYLGKLKEERPRSTWVQQIFDTATQYLKDVRLTFQNYTLHDETHVLNVLDAMAGILGDQIDNLTVGEMELLVLSASLHDLGMVYTEKSKKLHLGKKGQIREFLRKNAPELLGCPPQEWSADIVQWYLRSLHPFRLPEILQEEQWKNLFSAAPVNIVPKKCILAVCQAHGEAPSEFANGSGMDYLVASDVDPLFCALILRLADLLDFDDTRAPKVLYSYVACNEQSKNEWKKHQASGGFYFPKSPTTNSLPYKARCTDPGIEHTIRDFLDWIDGELIVCARLQQKCHSDWQRNFLFPHAVLREEIESDGYVSGDFSMTMDQSRIMALLTGENLYGRDDIFVRELLQNAIDATLLRVEMDEDFSLEDARVDLWEWNDKDGAIWFRIDDQGTGMTQGMLQRYFLKVGNSYYTSKELKRDLRDHKKNDDYRAISRFGIGFLSCFLCGTYAEVSTLYFDSQKNCEENGFSVAHHKDNYGLRLQVTGLDGYYTLKSQVEQHLASEVMPAPDNYCEKCVPDLEQEGYRAKPGTSISIKLDPGRLGAIDLSETVREYLCCAKVPVYYNGERIGRTQEEAIESIRQHEGETVYELPPDTKDKFDKCFPACAGQYPKLHCTVISLDAENNRILPDLSGAFIKYDVRFQETPRWEVKGERYELRARTVSDSSAITIYADRENGESDRWAWENLIRNHPIQAIRKLEAALDALAVCPSSPDELGDAWAPFASDEVTPYQLWMARLDYCEAKRLSVSVEELGAPIIDTFTGGDNSGASLCSYHGIVAGKVYRYSTSLSPICLLLLLDGNLCPTANTSRSHISDIPLELTVALHGIRSTWAGDAEEFPLISDYSKMRLPAWRKLHNSTLDKWLDANLSDQFENMKKSVGHPLQSELEDSLNIRGGIWGDSERILWAFLMVKLQDSYQMTVNYEAGQVISFCDKSTDESNGDYDLFPPMMFCSAASTQSRQFLCSADSGLRRCITLDHPYAAWLVKNAVVLDRYYQRQFQQIVVALCRADADRAIEVCNNVREQLLLLPERHGVSVSACPQLSEGDFWHPDEHLS